MRGIACDLVFQFEAATSVKVRDRGSHDRDRTPPNDLLLVPSKAGALERVAGGSWGMVQEIVIRQENGPLLIYGLG
ncbi:unnamed protein product [Nezara viridula]|uniref:Uncharacterized protein n=1 Tax=Nezara viridula TaxID=85310 RepID=A0A9P0EFF0_NEZVI|nr:unnamed protein product [Nezara viridula]